MIIKQFLTFLSKLFHEHINLKDVLEDSKSLNETNYQSMSRDEAILKNIFVKAVV